MIRERLQKSALAPWTGLAVPAVLWAVHHQLGSDLIFFDCRSGRTGLIPAFGVLFAVLTIVSGWVSWTSRGTDRPTTARGLAAALGASSAGLVFLALSFQVLASVLIPACHR